MSQGFTSGVPISTDGTLSANSDFLIPSQKAVKTYADTKTTLAVVNAQNLSVFAATTSAQLAGVISDETGTGVLVFSASPTFTGVPLAPTAAAGTDTTQIATTAFVQTAIAPLYDDSILMYKSLGSPSLAITIPISDITTTIALSNQTFFCVAIYLQKGATITGVKWWQAVQGSYTADNYNGVGLFTYSLGTLTLVASSTNDGNIWKATANTLGSKAFSSTYVAVEGMYFVGALWCRSAVVSAPTLGFKATTVNAGTSALDFTNSGKMQAFISAQTTLAGTMAMSTMTSSAFRCFFTLY